MWARAGARSFKRRAPRELAPPEEALLIGLNGIRVQDQGRCDPPVLETSGRHSIRLGSDRVFALSCEGHKYLPSHIYTFKPIYIYEFIPIY